MTAVATGRYRRSPAQRACRTVGALQMAVGALAALALWNDAGLVMIGVVLFAAGFVIRYLP